MQEQLENKDDTKLLLSEEAALNFVILPLLSLLYCCVKVTFGCSFLTLHNGSSVTMWTVLTWCTYKKLRHTESHNNIFKRATTYSDICGVQVFSS